MKHAEISASLTDSDYRILLTAALNGLLLSGPISVNSIRAIADLLADLTEELP
jgi:hypothetical protein